MLRLRIWSRFAVTEMITSRLAALLDALSEMELDAVSQGFSMISRLRGEWETGVNRFDRHGEILLGTFRNEQLIGIGGLNRDPYVDDPRVGRLRHLYVMANERRAGIGTSLVKHLLKHAADHFDLIRLWTDRAGAFYDGLGFERVAGPKVTHLYSIPRAG
jgi:N-acetylglutamate synthase-like GNAT family acetyltransferase